MRFRIALFLVLFIGLKAIGQFKNYRENLPQINVLAINESNIELGKISVKFFRNQFERNKNLFPYIIDTNFNNLSKHYQFTTIEPLFKNVLKNIDFQSLHKSYDLDLWFTINFNETCSVKQLYLELKKLNLFEVIEPVYKKHLLESEVLNEGVEFTPNDSRFNEQWHYNNTGQANGKVGKDIKLAQAWDIETGNPNVLVAVHDMGIQLDHPDLSQNIAVGKSFNFVDNNDTIVMGYHGTHVAGTIAAVNNNNIGVSGIAGGNGNLNSGARLMSIQIFKGNRGGGFAEGFIYAADKGAAISNNSWAYNEQNVYEISVLDAIDYFIDNGGGAALKGGLVIFAAGNVSRNLAYYPSSYERVICVAATNNRDEKANYSTYGPYVDISAPGGDFSAGASSQVLSTTFYSGYAGDHGTSMACPHVAGVAALVASKLIGIASAADVRDILLSTTDNIDSLNTNFKGLLGTGRLNAFKALQKATDFKNNFITTPVDSFKAIKNCNNINLKWKLNASNDSVIIAYSNINDIGTPINGLTYSLNDKIGNGKIIYKGKANNFLVSKTDDSLHFFKIWSKTFDHKYSLSRSAEIVDDVTMNGSGVLLENFNYPPYFPTQSWNVINPDKDLSWYHTAGDTANTGAGDLYSMCMYNYQYNTLLGAVDYLTSPVYRVQNSDSLQISFWFAYQYRNTGNTIADSLELLISTDCGLNYTSLWKKGGTNLATVASTTDSAFYPFGINKWKQQTIDISAYKNFEKIKFAFKSVNGKGNNIFIDNISLNKRYKLDAEIVTINQPNLPICGNTFTPEIVVKNNGNNDINNLSFQYDIDGNIPTSLNWNGVIKKDESKTIVLNPITSSEGNHQLNIKIINVNSVTDDFATNNSSTKNFIAKANEQLPATLNFEENNFPNKGWYILQSPQDDIAWTKTNLYGKGSGSSIVMKNFFYNDRGNYDDFISPIYSVDRNLDSAFLIFDYAHATRLHPDSVKYKFDSLEIAISKDCGVTWNIIWKKGGKGLQTINQTTTYDKEFFPDQTDWKRDSLFITNSFQIGDQTQFRFRNINQFGNNLYIDNIKVYTKYLAPDTKSQGFAVYPNPFQKQINIQHLNTPTELKAIIIYDILGKKVAERSFEQSALKDEVINTNNLKPSVYMLNLVYKNEVKSIKMIKLN
jgi:hypothetical protein